MQKQSPLERITNFSEVALGLTVKQMLEESSRCLQCKHPLCVQGCPVGINIPGFINLLKQNKFAEAAQLIKESNTLPAVCGRVCPQEEQCEKMCILGKKGRAVNIGALERFAADYEMFEGKAKVPGIPKSNNIKIAIFGSGPSGLTCAGELAKAGFSVTVFEALHELGGVLTYGIPEFRLPKKIVQSEIDYLREWGVEFKVNYVIGRIKTIEELFQDGFKAIYIATGAGYPQFMNIEGENLNFIYSANEFLTRVNLMRSYKFPESATPIWVGETVAVIGGGNTAMDSARCALRLGPKKVYLIYRRSENEMPARLEEVENAKEEGIEFKFLTNPVKYLGDKEGNVQEVECVKMELGEPDSSGRRRPVPVTGSNFRIKVNSVIVAIGTEANPLIASVTKDLKTNQYGYIIIDKAGKTSLDYVYAGGDIVSGSATVIKAMGAGKLAAKSIIEKLVAVKI